MPEPETTSALDMPVFASVFAAQRQRRETGDCRARRRRRGGRASAGADADGRRRRDTAGVRHRNAGRVRRRLAVRELRAVVDRGRRLGILLLAQRRPDLGALSLAPYFASEAILTSADCISCPPPLPKSPPITSAIAIRSVSVKCLGLPWPVTSYSPGKLSWAID